MITAHLARWYGGAPAKLAGTLSAAAIKFVIPLALIGLTTLIMSKVFIIPATATVCMGSKFCRYDASGGLEGRVATCSQANSRCMQGGNGAACEQRRRNCISTGCWKGPKFQRCGLTRN